MKEEKDYVIFDDVDGDQPTETKPPRIGQFKTKDKFIEFVGGKGNVNFITDEAFVESKYLSGSLDHDMKFKLTICDEGTVDFEEVDTQFTSTEERQRLLDIISDKSLSPSRIKNHFIVSEIPFIATKQVNGKDLGVYLAVEHQTPINRLASLFDDDGEQSLSINEQQDSNLDRLLSMFDDDTTTDEPAIIEPANEVTVTTNDKSESQKMLEDSFKKMKEDKIQELKNKISHQQKELQRYKSEKSNAERKITSAEDDIKLLESRLDTLVPNDESNGYVFFVSEELNQKVNLPADIEALIREKVTKVKGINVEGFMKLFEGGEYQIRIGKIENGEPVEVTDYEGLSEEIKEKLNFVHLHDGKLIHHGDLKWHDLIQKMLKIGFEQSSDFDKLCGSNSFGTNQGTNSYNDRNNIQTFEQFNGENDEDEDEDEDEDLDINDDFIFAISVVPAAQDEPSVFVSVSPKRYFDQNGYCYDQHLESILKKKYPLLKSLGYALEELQEASFVVGDGTGYHYCNLDETVDIFCKAGLLPYTACQRFLDRCSGQNDLPAFQNSVTSQGHKLY